MKKASLQLVEALNKLKINGMNSPDSNNYQARQAEVQRRMAQRYKDYERDVRAMSAKPPNQTTANTGGNFTWANNIMPQAQTTAAPANFGWANNLMEQQAAMQKQADDQKAYEAWVKAEQEAYANWKNQVDQNQAALIAIEQERAAREEKKRQAEFWDKSGLAAFRDMGYMKPDAYKTSNLKFHEANISGSNGLYNAAKGRGNNKMFARNI